MLLSKYCNKKILITGHTGFKGSWLALWLTNLGAKVYGLSNDVPTIPSNFEVLNIENNITDIRSNILDTEKTIEIVNEIKPDYIFHLAAQPLVRPSYDDPIKTLKTNSIGTANILESLRLCNNPVTAVFITSDKAYDNLELNRGYIENDILGGKDPYSASKGMAELALKTYYHSFFKEENSKIKLAVTRAGNVIGGGDWAIDRIVPDCVKAWAENKAVNIRNPDATRPWQHVLEPLGGYLLLGILLTGSKKLNGEAFNFGPKKDNDFSVRELIVGMQKHWSNVEWRDLSQNQNNVYEANLLRLNCQKAYKMLNWQPILNFEETIKMTAEWYKAYYSSENMFELTKSQINRYSKLLNERGII